MAGAVGGEASGVQRLGRIGERGPRAWWLGQSGARGRQDEEREGGAGAAQRPG